MTFGNPLVPVLLAFALCAPLAVIAADQPKSSPERDHAFELFREGKMVDAMPLLEELAAKNPQDVAVTEYWGAAVLGYAQTLTDPELKKKSRARARTILLQAQALGDQSDLLRTLLRDLPEDGSFAAYSDKKEVDEAMQQAEADFARGDLEKARQAYMRAYLLDPSNYYSALFIGDTYFQQKQAASAGEWFLQATRIDPNKETAFRYWGDALLAAGRLDEARSKYIEAIIADPYNQTSWNGLRNWLNRSKSNLTWIRLKDGVAVELKDGKTNITLDSSLPKDDPLAGGWLAYGMARALWMTQKFTKEYPKEANYRHSLKEETEALHMLIGVATAVAAKQKQASSSNDAASLAEIEKAGLLEPFALLNRADAGIIRDYPAYREANRDKLRRYLDEFVVPKTPPQSADATK